MKLMRGASEGGSRSTWDVGREAASVRVKRRGGVEVQKRTNWSWAIRLQVGFWSSTLRLRGTEERKGWK